MAGPAPRPVHPLDLDLAEHHVSVQGVVDSALVNEFVRRRGEVLRLAPVTLKNGQPLTVYVPLLSAPKRLLLNFSARGATANAVPILSRTEGSQIAARDLLGRLIGNRRASIVGLRDYARVQRVLVLVTTLVFSNPHRLAERLEIWSKGRDKLRRDRGLNEENLVAWVKQECDEFAGPYGSVLGQRVSQCVSHVDVVPTPIPRHWRPDGLRYFPSVPALVVHAVQDLLKNVVQERAPWPPAGGELNQRAALMQDPDELARLVTAILRELPLLTELIANQRDVSATAELFRHLDRWTAYGVVNLNLGVPFVVKMSQTLPLTARRRRPWYWRPFVWVYDKLRLIRTFHNYPLALQDALSVHAEVVIPDPELRLARRSEVVRFTQWRRRARVRFVFGHELRPTGRLLQRYSSRRPEEVGGSPSGYEPRPYVFLRVQLKLLRSILRGYTFASLAFLLAGIYVSWIFGAALIHHAVVSKPSGPLTIGALAVTLSLWLTAVQHRRAVVYRKLWIARRCFYVALVLILTPAALYGARYAWPHAFYAVAHRLGEWAVVR